MIENLPVEEYKKEIEKLVGENSIVIITAETGAGKSTVIPLWMSEKGLKVVVTQPRRIAARSLATYIAKKTKTVPGERVGYQTGFERKISKNTRLKYVTDGVQMVNEIRGNLRYDVLVIDEIHEWNLNQEVLIGLIKKKSDSGYLQKHKKKIIIMSATMQSRELSKFLNNAPIIEIPGRGYPVSIHNHHKDFILSDCVEMVRMNRNILVFQPGKKEISDFSETLKESLRYDKLKAKILPLHSEISPKEQGEVFKHFNIPKVVIATDIAQTSITIDDIDSVIDTGLKKELRNKRGVEGLFLTYISESECKQRAGRAGRVKTGQYILCSDVNMKDRIDFPEPEIRRLNLESVVLRLIKWDLSPLDFNFFHSPKKGMIYRAISKLKIFGAVDEDGKITEDGRLIAELPVSVRSARMLIEARKGGKKVLDEILKIIAVLEVKGIGSNDFIGVKLYEDEFRSDLLNHLTLWNTPKLHKKSVNFKKLFLAKEIYRELKKRIKDELSKNEKSSELDENDMLIRAIISGFPDFVYKKAEDSSYILGEQNFERRLDNRSILDENKPNMLVALPFDLTIKRENRETGEMETKSLALLTLASEINLKELSRLTPFSFRKISKPIIKKGILLVKNTYYFGGVIIAEKEIEPDWKDKKNLKIIKRLIFEWLEKNIAKLKIAEKYERLRGEFAKIREVLKNEEFKPMNFSHYWKLYIDKIIDRGLSTNDLTMFFNFAKTFEDFSIRDILPNKITRNLINRKIPSEICLSEEVIEIKYKNGIPTAKMRFEQFEKMKKEEVVLFSGARLHIILEGKEYNQWSDAVKSFNKWKREYIFKTKWKELEKRVNIIEDVENIEFPQVIEGGVGKEKEKFLYYIVPKIKNDEAYLIHFENERKAVNYFDNHKVKWEEFLKNYKNNKIRDIFEGKGWKIRK